MERAHGGLTVLTSSAGAIFTMERAYGGLTVLTGSAADTGLNRTNRERRGHGSLTVANRAPNRGLLTV